MYIQLMKGDIYLNFQFYYLIGIDNFRMDSLQRCALTHRTTHGGVVCCDTKQLKEILKESKFQKALIFKVSGLL